MEKEIAELLSKEKYNIYDLAMIVKVLRSENGCPWDKIQTHQSIRNDFLEEVYEVIEAIDCNSSEMLKEELGDVLLQVVFHAEIETEKGKFDLDEIEMIFAKSLLFVTPMFSAMLLLRMWISYLKTGTLSKRRPRDRKAILTH